MNENFVEGTSSTIEENDLGNEWRYQIIQHILSENNVIFDVRVMHLDDNGSFDQEINTTGLPSLEDARIRLAQIVKAVADDLGYDWARRQLTEHLWRRDPPPTGTIGNSWVSAKKAKPPPPRRDS